MHELLTALEDVLWSMNYNDSVITFQLNYAFRSMQLSGSLYIFSFLVERGATQSCYHTRTLNVKDTFALHVNCEELRFTNRLITFFFSFCHASELAIGGKVNNFSRTITFVAKRALKPARSSPTSYLTVL